MDTPVLDRLDRIAAEDAYHECKEIIRLTVRRFYLQYGGDEEAYMSQSNEIFLNAFGKYDPATCQISFKAHVKRCIWFQLLDTYRNRLRGQRLIPREPKAILENVSVPTEEEDFEFNLAAFLQRLSDDARLVAGLTVTMPPELAAVAAAKGGQPRNIRSTIREHLQHAGWLSVQVTEAFAEVAEALG